MNKLEEKIGYFFKDESLLVTALTHTSYSNERRGMFPSYERLEFLGDSILGFVTADFLYHHEPAIPEGRMTRLRAELVCEQNLYRVACGLGISDYMLLGRGEEKNGGRERVSVLADMVEAIIAAIFTDSGITEASRFIMDNILNVADISEYHAPADYKTELQELLQRDGECSIVYEEVSESGPDHNKTFTFRVVINGVPGCEGTGKTKKEAERTAAEKTLEIIRR